MLSTFGNWLKDSIKGKIPERPVSEELKQAKQLGFNIGAIVVRTHDYERRFEPQYWKVITGLVENGRYNSNLKQTEYFQIREITNSSYTGGNISFALGELVLIQAAPTQETIEIFSGKVKSDDLKRA